MRLRNGLLNGRSEGARVRLALRYFQRPLFLEKLWDGVCNDDVQVSGRDPQALTMDIAGFQKLEIILLHDVLKNVLYDWM